MRSLLLFCLVLLAGCVTARGGSTGPSASSLAVIEKTKSVPVADFIRAVDHVLSDRGFEPIEIKAGTHVLKAHRHRHSDALGPLEIAILGDLTTLEERLANGQRRILNINRELYAATEETVAAMMMDQAARTRNIVLLHRPCYFVAPEREPYCADPAWWRERKYSPAVVESLSAGIDHLIQRFGRKGEKVHLIGASVGGLLALQLAAQREDVGSVRTVSTPFDVHALAKWQNATGGLSAEPDMRAISAAVHRIPTIHHIGNKDSVIPPGDSQKFAAGLGGQHCASFKYYDAGHLDGPLAILWRSGVPGIPTCGLTAQAQ